MFGEEERRREKVRRSQARGPELDHEGVRRAQVEDGIVGACRHREVPFLRGPAHEDVAVGVDADRVRQVDPARELRGRTQVRAVEQVLAVPGQSHEERVRDSTGVRRLECARRRREVGRLRHARHVHAAAPVHVD
jgi:hypothetical protein